MLIIFPMITLKVYKISKVELGNNGDMEVVWSGPPRLEGCAKPSPTLPSILSRDKLAKLKAKGRCGRGKGVSYEFLKKWN